MRSTLVDVARDAGVSSATVDRVLNNRQGVRERTREIVLEAAQRLGYLPEKNGKLSRIIETVQLKFVLPGGTNPFIRELHKRIEEYSQSRSNIDVQVELIEGFDPPSLVQSLQKLEENTSGVGVIAIDHPTVREAIRSLAAKNIKVVTIASDILHVPRIAYIGIDNRAAGRLAGYLLGRFLGASESRKIALFAGSLSYRGHEEREMGFRHIVAEEFKNLAIVELREVLDDHEKAYTEAASLLARHPDLAGIYNIGAGNQGIARALRESGRALNTVFVAHEITSDNKDFLLDGTIDAIIDQNPRVEAREAISVLNSSIRGEAVNNHPPRLQVIFRENIPEI